MYKPSYSVVTGVLVFFALLAFVRHTYVGLIPRSTNSLATSRQKFLAAAGHEEIVWHVVEDNIFEEARRLDKPILLVVGLSTTRLGGEFDWRGFDDPDTARFLSLNFYCVRVDGFEHPDWLNALMPVSRARIGLIPSYQVWTLDYGGNVLNLIGRTYEGSDVDSRSLYRAMVGARDQYEAARAQAHGSRPPADLQSDDLLALATPGGVRVPNLTEFSDILSATADPRFGGFPQGQFQELYPNSWRYMTLCGNHGIWNETIGPILVSKMVDVQDGGFFRTGFGRGIDEAELGKNTSENAEMMLALATDGQLMDDTLETDLARYTFDYLVSCVNRNGLLPACQDDDESPQGRSIRYSFPIWRLHDVLSESDRNWSYDRLGLNSLKNKQMLPYIASRSTVLDFQATYDRVIGLMRASTVVKPQFNDLGYLDVNGHSLARMLEVARLWGDERRMLKVLGITRRLSGFRDSSDLMHRSGEKGTGHGYLGDYLAMSDARLQEYMATTKPDAMQEGLHYLNLARRLFQGAHPGQLNLSRTAEDLDGIESLCVPEIADNTAESCTAQAIRLELDYGRLTADTPGGQELIAAARQSMAAFARVAPIQGLCAGGYFCAAADLMDGRYAIAVGPDARRLADGLYRQVPTRFIAPAVGPYRRDLQKRRPGIYLIGKDVQGPLSIEDAADLLPATLTPASMP